MSRYKASFIHFLISVAVGGATLAFMLGVWYWGPFFEAAGGSGLILILLAVDVTIGPLITLIIFNTAKKSLKFDLAVVAMLQIGALVYGLSVIFEARPVYLAFVVDRFELIRASDIDPADLAQASLPQFKSLPLGRPEIIAVDLPTDSEEKRKALELAFAGKDIHLLPKLYAPLDAKREKDMARAALPISKLKEANPDKAGEIAAELAKVGQAEAAIGYFPLKARSKDMCVIVSRDTGKILAYWSFKPWKT